MAYEMRISDWSSDVCSSDLKGKLQRFNAIVDDARKRLGDEFPIAENYALHIHHYLSTAQAKAALAVRAEAANKEWDDGTFGSISVHENSLLPASPKLRQGEADAMGALCEKYYVHGLYLRLMPTHDEQKTKDPKH